MLPHECTGVRDNRTCSDAQRSVSDADGHIPVVAQQAAHARSDGLDTVTSCPLPPVGPGPGRATRPRRTPAPPAARAGPQLALRRPQATLEPPGGPTPARRDQTTPRSATLPARRPASRAAIYLIRGFVVAAARRSRRRTIRGAESAAFPPSLARAPGHDGALDMPGGGADGLQDGDHGEPADRRDPADVGRRVLWPKLITETGAAVTFREAPGDRGTGDPRRSRALALAGRGGRGGRGAAGLGAGAGAGRALPRGRRVKPGVITRSGGRGGSERRPSKMSPPPTRPRKPSELRRGREVRPNLGPGHNTVQVENVPDPKILNDRDAIVRITSTAICGSDLHLYDGYIPTMEKGDILGHEFMGEVVEVGRGCRTCRSATASSCRSRSPAATAGPASTSCTRCARTRTRTRGWPRRCSATRPAGIFGYSHLTGGYAGGQAEYARVPFADVGPLKIEDDLPTSRCCSCRTSSRRATWARSSARSSGGEVIAVFGAGPVGQFAIASAVMLGAERVIAIDQYDYRLADGAQQGGRHRHDQLRRGRRHRRAAQGADRRARPRTR